MMDEEDRAPGKPSSIKPPMIKPPMSVPPPASVSAQSAPPRAAFQAPPGEPSPVRESANKLVIVINIILALALIVGLFILAYRWLK
jgi:hypothetical protein